MGLIILMKSESGLTLSLSILKGFYFNTFSLGVEPKNESIFRTMPQESLQIYIMHTTFKPSTWEAKLCQRCIFFCLGPPTHTPAHATLPWAEWGSLTMQPSFLSIVCGSWGPWQHIGEAAVRYWATVAPENMAHRLLPHTRWCGPQHQSSGPCTVFEHCCSHAMKAPCRCTL